MTIINITPDRIIQLGYEGEDRVTVLRFRYGADWLENGEGIFNIRVRRHGEHTAYNAALVTDDAENNCLLMTVTDVELSVKGSGEMQVVYSGENFVKKSPIYSYNVSRAVDEVADPPAQDVYTQIIESLSDLQMDVHGLADAVDGIGNLAELTTETKTDLVSAINEVNAKGGGGGSVTVDSELSTTSRNPVQNKVITARINGLDSDVGTLRTSVQSKADTQTVFALSDAVQDLDGDIQGLQTAMQGKADKTTATASADGLMSAQDKAKLDGLDNGISDVQINGTSIVTDGVAEMPIAMLPKSGYAAGNFGVVALKPYRGIAQNNEDKSLFLAYPSANMLKQGVENFTAVTVATQNSATFYGLAKAAGHDEKNSTLPVGTYSEEAKTAIRTMLGLQEMYEWYKNQT